MSQLTFEDIWYIYLGVGALLTMIPAGMLLTSIFTKKKEINPNENKKYLTAFFLLFLAFSFEFSALYMVVAEVSNPLKGLPTSVFASFIVSGAITISMYLVQRSTK